MRKGFVAAPLIGTIIFLAAVVFIINLQNVEAQTSVRIANDAYHNRVASVLEQHRSDLASIFREGLSRTISYYLLNPGWDVFTWNNDPNARYYSTDNGFRDRGLDPDPLIDGSLDGRIDNRISLSELKYAKCETVRALTSDVICSIPEASGNIGNELEYKYGLPQWMSKFVEDDGTFVFEGITFVTSNVEQVKVFLPGSREGISQTQAIQEYQDYCGALLRGSVFDCKAFATQNEMKCVDYDANGNGVREGGSDEKQLEGCEDGRFFVKINVENVVDGASGPVEVYPKLPRVEAKDTGGNTFRSSGIGEKNFYLPINLRVFKYFDETFKAYDRLAYGPSGDTGSSAGSEADMKTEGIADGHCGETNPACTRAGNGFSDDGYPIAGNPTDDDTIKKTVSKNYFDFVFKPACMKPNLQPQSMELKFCSLAGDCDAASSPKCDDTLDYSQYQGSDIFLSVMCDMPGEADKCAYFKKNAFRFLLVDNNAAFRIDPREPVNFEWGADIQHDKR